MPTILPFISGEAPVTLTTKKFFKSDTDWYHIFCEWTKDEEKAQNEISYKTPTLAFKSYTFGMSSVSFQFADGTYIEFGINTDLEDTMANVALTHEFAYTENLGYGMIIYFRPKDKPHGEWALIDIDEEN